jgi:5-oxopent-3-ene-1,2,5-tricarboxylate decarboxylase/2-hydroxyhepta-2,4-diene-1,7-dioate isomerase
MMTTAVLYPRGTVYTAVLNFRGVLDQLGDALNQDPYQRPPIGPVLMIKPPSTWIGHHDFIPCPAGVQQLRMGGTLAVVMGRAARQVTEADALDYVAGYTIANDVSIPHQSYYRPPIAARCRDGFCPLATNQASLQNPDNVEIHMFINGELSASNTTANLARPVARLIADVTEFITLRAGDLLLVGEPENAPLAGIGDTVRVDIENVGFLENVIVPEASL